MDQNNFSPENENAPLGSAELSQEQQEIYNQKSQQAQKQLQRVQKDEQKAVGDNKALFKILLKFIQDPYYQEFIPTISHLLSLTTPSRLIITFIALFYPDAAHYITQTTNNSDKLQLLLDLPQYEGEKDFDENNIDESIRIWITTWISLTTQFLTDPTTSVLMEKKGLEFLEGEHKKDLQKALGQCFAFLFEGRHIHITNEKSYSYAGFLQKNLISALQVSLIQHTGDKDLLEDTHLSSKKLFGL